MGKCPHRDKCPFPEMRPPGDDGLFHFEGFRVGRRYQNTTTQPWGQVHVHNPAQPAPQPSGPLNPGETQWRVLDEMADIRPQLRMGLVVGGLVVVAGACVYAGIAVDGAWPVAVIVGVADLFVGFVFVRLNWDLLGWGKHRPDVDRLVSRTREAETQADATPRRVLTTIRVEDGRTTRYLGDIPVTPEMQAFAGKVLDGASFSESTAKEVGLDIVDFRTLRDELIGRDVLKWKNSRNHRSGYVWTVAAKRVLGQIRDFPLPSDGV